MRHSRATKALFAAALVGRWSAKLIVRCLTIVGALWVTFHSTIFAATVAKEHWWPDRAVASFLSPDGREKAEVFLSTRGGDCDDAVYVVPVRREDVEIWGRRELVYSGSCGGLWGWSDGHYENNVRWTSETVLEINFAPRLAAIGRTAEFRTSAMGGGVEIEFVLQ